MNAEQLHSARLARWSQNGDARLTLEAAAEWMEIVGLGSFLPAESTAIAPIPSFLEAVVGRPAQSPSAGERSRARELLARVVEQGGAVPLLLSGSHTGEQPDFLSSPEALRYIYALRSHRNPKTGPPTTGKDKVSPLAEHCWQAIEQHGPMDVAALQAYLGGELTAAAVARALEELWSGLYCMPIIDAQGGPAQWDLLARRFSSQLTAGAGTGQTEALSAMVSLYLSAVVAATEDDVVRILSPLAPQSKLRDLLRALGSMRQLEILDIGGRAHVALKGEGILPETVAKLSELPEAEISIVAMDEEKPRNLSSSATPGPVRKWEPKKFVPRRFSVPSRPDRSRFDIAASNPGNRPARREDTAGRERGPGKHVRRWEKSGERPGRGFGPKKSFSGPTFSGKPAGRAFSGRPGPGRPASSESDSSAPKRFSRSPGPGSERYFPRKSFSKPGKSDRPKPWAAKGDRPQKSWDKRGSFSSADPRKRDAEEGSPKRWEKSGSKSGERSPGSRPNEKPWRKSAAPPERSSDSAGRKTGKNSTGRKSWIPRSDRYAAEGRHPRREASERSGGDSEQGSSSRPGGSPDRKPFWAKNPRGGKGSTPASRTHRPRGGKPGGKKR